MIDLIIPTLWKFNLFKFHLEKYITYKNIGKIIIISNDRVPENFVPKSDKIHLHQNDSNLYVNESWNIGVSLSKNKVICISNDDFFVQEECINLISKVNFNQIDLIGTRLVDKNNQAFSLEKFHKTKNKNISLGSYHEGFGYCMFLERLKYKKIPSSLFKIWFGDDYLVYHSKVIYTISLFFDTNICAKSATINSKDNKKINSVVQRDLKNYINSRNFLFF